MLEIQLKHPPIDDDSENASAAAARTSGAPLTRLLLLLLVGAGGLLLWAAASLTSARDNALAAGDDLGVCREYLADLERWNSGSSPTSAMQGGESALAGRLSAAAKSAGVADVASVEPGQPSPVRDTDFSQTPVFVRVNAVSLRQLVTFLHGVSEGASMIRTQAIELSPAPDVPAAKDKRAGDELWTADVTLAYLTYAPREKSR